MMPVALQTSIRGKEYTCFEKSEVTLAKNKSVMVSADFHMAIVWV